MFYVGARFSPEFYNPESSHIVTLEQPKLLFSDLYLRYLEIIFLCMVFQNLYHCAICFYLWPINVLWTMTNKFSFIHEKLFLSGECYKILFGKRVMQFFTQTTGQKSSTCNMDVVFRFHGQDYLWSRWREVGLIIVLRFRIVFWAF